MDKHAQTIRRQQPTNYLSVFDHFVELALKGLNSTQQWVNNEVITSATLDQMKSQIGQQYVADKKVNKLFPTISLFI